MKNYTKMLYVIDMVNGFVTEGVRHDEYIAHTIDEQVALIKKFILKITSIHLKVKNSMTTK